MAACLFGKTHVIRLVASVSFASVAFFASGCGTPAPAEPPIVPEFEKRVAAYLEVQKRATADLPALKRTDDPLEITSRETAMGAAIRAARAGAKPGDIMAPEVATYLRRLVKEDLQGRTPEEQTLMKDEIPSFEPEVNQTYPSEHPLATFPAGLLKVMPSLPEGLEYRFLTRALIIRDVKANIIVDFIRDVF